MKHINFIGLSEDFDAKDLLNYLWSIDGDYENDARPRLERLGYYVPKEQYIAYMKVIDIQYQIDQYGDVT